MSETEEKRMGQLNKILTGLLTDFDRLSTGYQHPQGEYLEPCT
jgi:hypothetical protein